MSLSCHAEGSAAEWVRESARHGSGVLRQTVRLLKVDPDTARATIDAALST